MYDYCSNYLYLYLYKNNFITFVLGMNNYFQALIIMRTVMSQRELIPPPPFLSFSLSEITRMRWTRIACRSRCRQERVQCRKFSSLDQTLPIIGLDCVKRSYFSSQVVRRKCLAANAISFYRIAISVPSYLYARARNSTFSVSRIVHFQQENVVDVVFRWERNFVSR